MTALNERVDQALAQQRQAAMEEFVELVGLGDEAPAGSELDVDHFAQAAGITPKERAGWIADAEKIMQLLSMSEGLPAAKERLLDAHRLQADVRARYIPEIIRMLVALQLVSRVVGNFESNVQTFRNVIGELERYEIGNPWLTAAVKTRKSRRPIPVNLLTGLREMLIANENMSLDAMVVCARDAVRSVDGRAELRLDPENFRVTKELTGKRPALEQAK